MYTKLQGRSGALGCTSDS